MKRIVHPIDLYGQLVIGVLLALLVGWQSGFLKWLADEASFLVIRIFLILFAEGVH